MALGKRVYCGDDVYPGGGGGGGEKRTTQIEGSEATGTDAELLRGCVNVSWCFMESAVSEAEGWGRTRVKSGLEDSTDAKGQQSLRTCVVYSAPLNTYTRSFYQKGVLSVS